MRLLQLGFVFVAVSVAAQTLTVGTSGIATTSASPDVSGTAVRTDVDLVSPATASGVITNVVYGWSATGCPSAVKIKFLRRSGTLITTIAERGPFTASATVNTVTLSPPVNVEQGDLIGITRLTSCGAPVRSFPFPSTAGYIQYASDSSGTFEFESGLHDGHRVLVGGSGDATESLAGVIPVVGSTKGLFGSNWKTSIQLQVPIDEGTSFPPVLIKGRLVFHLAGSSGSPSDPSLPFSLTAGQVVAYSDVIAAMGQFGLGSIDVIMPSVTAGPIGNLLITTRVYNDAGTAGTCGTDVPLFDPNTSIGSGLATLDSTSYLVTPPDVTKARFNVGIRTLFSGATINVTWSDASGKVLRKFTRAYPPRWVEQVDAAMFLGGLIDSNQSIQIQMALGSAIIYGAFTDNITNDPIAQLAIVPPFGVGNP